jgi:spore coat protein CotF
MLNIVRVERREYAYWKTDILNVYKTPIYFQGGYCRMTAHYGAHEMMEIHEVLSAEIDGINTLQLYRPFVKDPQLRQMLDHQLQFMTNAYNNLVQMVHANGAGQAVPYRTARQFTPAYGLDNPAPQSPNMSAQQMDDRDVASGMLCIHKNGAMKQLMGALETANPNLRRALQQGAMNCAEQAYEVWQYMNEKGYYQVPTMKEMTTNTMMNVYQTAGGAPMAAGTQQSSMGMGTQQPSMNTPSSFGQAAPASPSRYQ